MLILKKLKMCIVQMCGRLVALVVSVTEHKDTGWCVSVSVSVAGVFLDLD